MIIGVGDAAWTTLGYSFSLGLSLILAIGAQNAFVLKQGLKGEFVFWVCLVCALSDAVLILLGVFGFAFVSEKLPLVAECAKWGGVVFLLGYGLRSFWLAAGDPQMLQPTGADQGSLSSVVLTCLAFTWLNPHVYLDTLILIGSVSTGFVATLGWFALGATSASFVFFFSLGYGAAWLRPLFAKPLAWRIMDGAIGVTMWLIAYSLIS